MLFSPRCFFFFHLFDLRGRVWGLHSLWDIRSLTRDRTCALCVGSMASQPWEVPVVCLNGDVDHFHGDATAPLPCFLILPGT